MFISIIKANKLHALKLEYLNCFMFSQMYWWKPTSLCKVGLVR